MAAGPRNMRIRCQLTPNWVRSTSFGGQRDGVGRGLGDGCGECLQALRQSHKQVVDAIRTVMFLALAIIPAVNGCSAPIDLGTVSGIIATNNGGGAGCANCTCAVPGRVQFVSHGAVERPPDSARRRSGTASASTPGARNLGT